MEEIKLSDDVVEQIKDFGYGNDGYYYYSHLTKEQKLLINNLIQNKQGSYHLNESIRQYMMSKTGATATVVQYLKQNNWI